MKTILSLLITLCISAISFAQGGINYKALIKDNNGDILANQTITIQFQILEGGTTNIYQETHNPTTDVNGFIIVNIGEGNADNGNFLTIDWGSTEHSLNIQVNTGAGFTDLGTTPFKHVPYAMHSKTADNMTGIKTMFYATANGPMNGLDIGQITSRVLTIVKKENNTAIRISYTDNLRTLGPNKACRWELKVNGNSSTIQPLVYDFFASLQGENPHRSRTLVGYFKGLTAGTHEIQVWVGPTPGYSNCDCYTGFSNSTWVLEAEEVN